MQARFDGRDQQLGGGACGERLGAQPPADERLGGAEQRGRERVDFDAVGGRELREQRLRDEVGDARAVFADAPRDAARGGERLVEQDAPGAAVAVDELEERVDARAQRLLRRRGLPDRVDDGGEQRVAGRLHAGEVEALLVAEVVVEQRLGDADRGRDLVHRDGGVAARGEQRVRGGERLLHAQLAREARAGESRRGRHRN